MIYIYIFSIYNSRWERVYFIDPRRPFSRACDCCFISYRGKIYPKVSMRHWIFLLVFFFCFSTRDDAWRIFLFLSPFFCSPRSFIFRDLYSCVFFLFELWTLSYEGEWKHLRSRWAERKLKTQVKNGKSVNRKRIVGSPRFFPLYHLPGGMKKKRKGAVISFQVALSDSFGR